MKPVHFILRTERPSPDGSSFIYMRVTFSRKLMPMFSTGKSIPLRKEYRHLTPEEIKGYPVKKVDENTVTRDELYYWDKAKERVTKGFGSMETINLFLDDEKKRANDIRIQE